MKKTITVRLDEKYILMAKDAAKRETRTMTGLIAHALRSYVESQSKDKK